MTYSFRAAIAASSIFAGAFAQGIASSHAGLITLEDPSLGAATFDQDWRPANGFFSGGAFFNNDYNAQFGSWADFALSSVTDITTPGFGNQYAAFAPARALGAGAGAQGSKQYAIGYVSVPFSPLPRISFEEGERPISLEITNSTYAALNMRDGDSFGWGKKFGGASGNDPDFYRLTITGWAADNSSTGTLDFYLADYRFANNAQDYIISDWTMVDLSSFLPTTRALEFNVASSDNDPEFGIKTPAYFAVDNITTAVPEPGTAALLALGLVGFATRRSRR